MSKKKSVNLAQGFGLGFLFFGSILLILSALTWDVKILTGSIVSMGIGTVLAIIFIFTNEPQKVVE